MESRFFAPGYPRRYVALESALRFFTDNNIQLGEAHSAYANYWRDNSECLPQIAARLSAGMLPEELISCTKDPVFLHDARIQSVGTNNGELYLKLHGDDKGGLRVIDIRYDCNGLEMPEIPSEILNNSVDCDLMCHEFHRQSDWFYHQILFANGTELTIQFRDLVADFNPDRDITNA